MSKFIDGPRFRGGVEVKTPASTRKVKEVVYRSESTCALVRSSLELLGCPAESHRLPKSFDKTTGEPKSYTWKVQPTKIDKVILLVEGTSGTPTCRAPSALVQQLIARLNGEPLVVQSEDRSGNPCRVLLSPYCLKTREVYYREPKIVGVEIKLIDSILESDLD